MSIELCAKCDTPIDTDYNVECYREELDDACICDNCFDQIDLPLDAADDIARKMLPAELQQWIEIGEQMILDRKVAA